MAVEDPYGLRVTVKNDAQVPWLEGLDHALTFDKSGIEPLEKAVERDPEFALGHGVLSRQLMIHGFAEKAQLHFDKALELKTRLKNELLGRELSTIDIMSSARSHDGQALSKAIEHLEQWPCDIFVFSHLVGPFGLLAFSGQEDWREQNVALMEKHQKHWPENDWWLLTTLAFMRAEIGDLEAARRDGELAWEIRPTGNCAHALSHLHIEMAAYDEGTDFLSSWFQSTGRTSDMRHHLSWHLSVLEMGFDHADEAAMQDLYKSELDPKIADPMPLSTFSDNASFLWRCYIRGFDVPQNAIRDNIAYMQRHYNFTGFVFADIHRIAMVILSKSEADFKTLKIDLDDAATRNPVHGALSQMADGFLAFYKGDFKQAVEILKPCLEQSVLLGGSNPQRDIVRETYQAAENKLQNIN